MLARRRRRWRWGRAVFAVVFLASILGCKTFSDSTAGARTALDANQPQEALKAINGALKVRSADETPSPLRKNDALLLLDRAMILQELRDYEKSSRDFQTADKAIEILDFSRTTANEISRYLFTDSAGPYKARPYEKLMLNSLNMVNYLVRDNLEGAKVEARRFTVMRDYLLRGNDEGEKRDIGEAGVVGSYLAGFTFQESGQREEALRYYDEALQAKTIQSLAGPVRELLPRSGFRTERLEALSKEGSKPAAGSSARGDAELLIVVSYGRVPAMVAKRLPIGLALTLAAAFLPPGTGQQARRLAGQGLVTWINFPELGPSVRYASPLVTVDNVAQPVDLVNIDAIARKSWEDSKGQVIAAAVVRMVARAAIGAGVGVATGQASKRSGLGVLAALVTQGGLAAADKPDTRSWATLPARIGLVRLRLPAGMHQVAVEIAGRRYVTDVDLIGGQGAVVDFTDLSQS